MVLLRAFTVILAALVLTAATSHAQAPAGVPTLKKWNQPIPPLALKDLQGQPRSLKEWRGKVVIVHFWATWCEPCVEEMPALMQLKGLFSKEPLEVVTVNLGESDSRVQAFFSKLGVNFITLLDRDGVARKKWGVGGVPMSFVLGADGRARYRYFGEIDWGSSDVNAKVAALAREARRLQKPAASAAGVSAPGNKNIARAAGL